MEMIAWVLVVLSVAAAGYFAWRGGRDREALGSVARLADDLRSGLVPEAPPEGDTEEIADLRRAIREHWVPRGSELEKGREEGRSEGRAGGQDEALRGMARYLEATVTGPLAEALDSEAEAEVETAARAALYALEDLAFFGRDLGDEDMAPASMANVVADVTREFARDYEVPVKFLGPDRPVRVTLAAEAMKDALYLLLVNAVRFGGGGTVEVRLQETNGTCALEVVDRGEGFTAEALERGTEPFYSTSPDSLGLGLTWAGRVASFHDGTLRVRNREEGGAAVEIRLPTTG